MGLRKIQRKVVKSQMKTAGVTQINKTHYKSVTNDGNATTVTRPSFFAMNWRKNR